MPPLNPRSPIPLYRQLADILLARIRSGEYPDGGRIPSEHALAKRYAIGRPTARQATDQLVQSGILVRRRGSGTFVRSEQKEVDLFSFAGTMASFRDRGLVVSARIHERTQLKEIGKDSENPFSMKAAFYFSRISTVDSVPVLMEDMYLDPTLFPGIDRVEMAGRSLSQIVDEQYYLRPVGGKQTFRIGYAHGDRAFCLNVDADTPILLVKRYLDFEPAHSAIFSELYCRTDRFIFSQILGGR
jgi:DNA-binding GntR family transcriptional regulator